MGTTATNTVKPSREKDHSNDKRKSWRRFPKKLLDIFGQRSKFRVLNGSGKTKKLEKNQMATPEIVMKKIQALHVFAESDMHILELFRLF
jgi:hypothetical protein